MLAVVNGTNSRSSSRVLDGRLRVKRRRKLLGLLVVLLKLRSEVHDSLIFFDVSPTR